MKNLKYLILSVLAAMILMFTILPYYCISSITIPGTDIYFSYDEVYRFFCVFFPICAFLGAVTTLRKKKTPEDVLINVTFPLLVLLYLRVYKEFLIICILLLFMVIAFILWNIYDAMTINRRWDSGKKWRYAYYHIRKDVTMVLFAVTIPLALAITIKENTINFRIHTFFRNYTATTSEELLPAKIHYQLSDEDTWKKMDSLEEKVWQLQCVADDCLGELGVTSVPVKAVTTLEPTVQGSYSEIDKMIYINKEFLEKATLQKTIHVIAHECHHRYQHAIIQSLMILEDADFPYEKLGYYQEAMALLKGAKEYKEDQENYFDYLKNEMEVQAEAYARSKLEAFAEKYGWNMEVIKR